MCTYDMPCGNPIEKLYYTAKYEPICIYCATSVQVNPQGEDHYPQCQDCDDNPHTQKD